MAVELDTHLPHHLYRSGAHLRLGLGSRRKGHRLTLGKVVKEGLRHLASARIVYADKEYFLHSALKNDERSPK
jgi:hypothetical protein